MQTKGDTQPNVKEKIKRCDSGRFLLKLLVCSAALLLLPALAVIIFDPFYHYHGPLPGLKAVLNDKEYQCIGSLRHLDYDSLLVGSSVVENFDNNAFGDKLGIKLIKAVRASGSTADLCYYINEAYLSRIKYPGNSQTSKSNATSSGMESPMTNPGSLKYIFYNIDIAALYMPTETSFKKTGQPIYLYNKNPFDDILYLWNKDVLLEKIPYMLANSLIMDYNDGLSYNWSSGKVFSETAALSHYSRPSEFLEMKPATQDEELLLDNLMLIGDIIDRHPETEFVFYYPPYSILWWDEAGRTGRAEQYLYAREITGLYLQEKARKNNCTVHLVDFQGERDIIFNLDNYMDTLHFSPEITELIFKQISDAALAEDFGGIDTDGLKSTNEKLKEMLPEIEQMISEKISNID